MLDTFNVEITPVIEKFGSYNKLTVYCGNFKREFEDCMQPEDANFNKDLGWIPELLLEVYGLGVKNGRLTNKKED